VDPAQLRRLLVEVNQGAVSVDAALNELRELPFHSLGGFANADTHRHLRTGYPEVVFGPGKTPDQIARILEELGRDGTTVWATRIKPDVARAVKEQLPSADYREVAGILIHGPTPKCDKGRGQIGVLSAGTSDIPVAEEAATTSELDGNNVTRIYDVGVSGLHRLLARRDEVQACEVLVVVAGMDGVLPTFVAGLFARPVIAVPTSIGYGAALGGLGALTTMLNACAAGVAVVNIDNGFGAGRMASMLNRKRDTGGQAEL